MHLNISSLQYHFEELNDLLETSKTKFSVIGITESRLKKGVTPISNINLQNYKIEHTPTASKRWFFIIHFFRFKLQSTK